MNPTETSILTGLKRVISSAKVQAGITGLTAAWATLHDPQVTSLPSMEKSAVWVAFEIAILVTLRAVINAWSAEDVAVSQGPIQPPGPTTQTNIGSDVHNEPPKAPDAQQTPPAPTGIAPPRTVTLKDGSTALLTLLTPPTKPIETWTVQTTVAPASPLRAAHEDVVLPGADQKKA